MIIGLFPNMGKENLFVFMPSLLSILERQEIAYLLPSYARKGLVEKGIYLEEKKYVSKERMGKECDVILSIGGDGSFLEAARQFADYPVMLAGIHLGDLGFLNTIIPSESEECLMKILHGEYELESRMFLYSFIRHGDGTETILSTCLNDIVTGHGRIGAMVRLCLFINDQFVQQYSADGLIVSTPTGSTGYALSCGGPILYPSAKEMLIVPVCPHMVYGFSTVLKSDDIVKIMLPKREGGLHISVDGSKHYQMKNTDTLYITGQEKKIRFIRFLDRDFFGELNTKFVRKICH